MTRILQLSLYALQKREPFFAVDLKLINLRHFAEMMEGLQITWTVSICDQVISWKARRKWKRNGETKWLNTWITHEAERAGRR